tara:strand:+ start:403 stop:582 length:180 start_codon:yes stop_codon:yes gene_type:complete
MDLDKQINEILNNMEDELKESVFMRKKLIANLNRVDRIICGHTKAIEVLKELANNKKKP